MTIISAPPQEYSKILRKISKIISFQCEREKSSLSFFIFIIKLYKAIPQQTYPLD